MPPIPLSKKFGIRGDCSCEVDGSPGVCRSPGSVGCLAARKSCDVWESRGGRFGVSWGTCLKHWWNGSAFPLAAPNMRRWKYKMFLGLKEALSVQGSISWLVSHTLKKKQGWIQGNPVADGWAGAVMWKPLGIQNCDRQTDGLTYRPTQQGVESRVRD